jgi:hypothetical protein
MYSLTRYFLCREAILRQAVPNPQPMKYLSEESDQVCKRVKFMQSRDLNILAATSAPQQINLFNGCEY